MGAYARRLFIATLLLLIISTLLNCAKADDPVEQYLEDICKSELRALQLQQSRPHSTWGQFHEDTLRGIRLIEQLDPPPVLEEYHEATLRVWRVLAEMIAEHDSSALVNDRELLPMMETLLLLDEAVNRTIEDLPDDVFAQVTLASC